MKIFSAAQIKACDAYTIAAAQIPSIDLMERAAARCRDWLTQHFSKDNLFVVLCGTGNNGGDGLALTRMLHHLGYGAKAFLLQYSKELSADCHANLLKLQQTEVNLLTRIPFDTFITDIPPHIIIIDAILGTGLNRPIDGWLAQFVKQINQLPNRKIAIDLPTGLPADNVPEMGSVVMKVDDTLCFHLYKRSVLHPEGGKFAGKVHILDIGLNKKFIADTHTNYHIIDEGIIKSIYQPRKTFSHKGTYGTALMIGGSYGMAGAICLCANAAGRVGAGKVKAIIPSVCYSIFQTLAPEATCTISGEKHIDELVIEDLNCSISVGSGMGTETSSLSALEYLFEHIKRPMVIDADALNLLAKHKEMLHRLPAGSIITPHPKEYERLFGVAPDTMFRLEHARTQAMRYNIVIVLKDSYTIVVFPNGECHYNLSGTPALATAGSGDVLTGMITGLLAQGYEPENAAILGVYLHGIAGQLAAKKQGNEAVLASNICQQIGGAYQQIY